MNLKQWLALARIKPNKPLPPELREELASFAAEVQRLALSRRTKPEKAAAHAAKIAGLTGKEIGDFREKQRAIYATMLAEFNIHQPSRGKVEAIEQDIANSLGVERRTVGRWRKEIKSQK